MVISIHDDFDLKKIELSGQCFRVKELDNNIFRFITLDHILYIKNINNNTYEVSCSKEEWNNIWHRYFDLDTNYNEIRKNINKNDKYILEASNFGKGIRILNQDSFEMLISFIISQQKQIPSIKKCIEAFSAKFGHIITTNYIIDGHKIVETIYSFPTINELKNITISDLSDLLLGYRDSYIFDAINRVKEGMLDLNYINNLSDKELLNELMSVKGVGIKVANCIALFAYHRTALAPIDTWIKKVIEKKYNGQNPFTRYGIVGGIIQQYIFYYATQNKSELG